MKNWQVQIVGHPYDLEDIFDNQASESWSIVKDIDQFYLVSRLFNDLEDAGDVRDLAPEILNLINGSAKLRISGFRQIEAGNVSCIDEEGHRRNFVLLQGSITARSKVRAAAIAVTPEGLETAETEEKPDRIEPTYTLAESNQNVADALRIFGEGELSWVDLYKIYEIIRDDVGNLNDLLNKEYVVKKDLKNFTRTAQHPDAIGDAARHARISADPPKEPMSFTEADLLISTLMIKWIDSKLA